MMIEPGAVLDASKLGVTIEVRETAASTGGEYVEFDVIGRARGLIAQPHVHAYQVEHHEVIEGPMRLTIDGREHVLRAGESLAVPAGAAHRQPPRPGEGVSGPARVRPPPAGAREGVPARLSPQPARRRPDPRGLPKA